ncbi:discoidin domain-containing protein [Haloferula sargassicola]|uniref:F5/8 type C domain-containing protein n=1 Tax=Haloferula sargassicola TaxID=490096 RepID=A0ABP9UJ86_9BACT
MPSLSIILRAVFVVSLPALAPPAVADLAWPEGRPLPAFPAPAEKLDALVVQDLLPDEQITFSALQGQVNRTKPRLILLDERAGEGRDTWLNTPGSGVDQFTLHPSDSRYDIIAKYGKELSGVVIYDPSRSEHYRNLACTVAGLEKALPVTREVLAKILPRGWDPKVVSDLTELPFKSATDIYEHLRKEYWPRCTKRLIVSARPFTRGGDLHHTRDMAAACGAAVVWLDPRDKAERKLLASFFKDMPAGDAVALGWYATERSGITTASEFGIGTIPSDFYNGSTVFAGGPREIQVPAVPKMPPLEDKIYVAMFISDGDNIQYVQHAMRDIWERSESVRGRVALNWTISPGLVDIGPGLLNYYYDSATSNDCFVSGPSGMGYLIPYNTLEEEGAPVGPTMTAADRINGYTRLTGRYTDRAGLRVVTIWDHATPEQRAGYERNCPQLYGLTVQNFKDVPSVSASVENDRLRFEKLRIPYAGSYDHIHGDLERAIRRWNGKEPLFLAYQMDVWHEMKPGRIVELHDNLQREFPDQIEFVRADHYFNLRNQAESLPYNLCLDPETKVRASSGDAARAIDGTPATHWKCTDGGEAWLGFDFGSPRTLRRYVVRHSESDGLRGVALQTSDDGTRWKTVDVQRKPTPPVTQASFNPQRARYARLVLKTADGMPGSLADAEIYGSR